MQDPVSNTTKVKRAEGMSPVVVHLPSTCEALSSKPSTAIKKKSMNMKNR
jgi:hypothetical protein